MSKTEWLIDQPVIIYCPAQKFYIQVVLLSNGGFLYQPQWNFRPEYILTLEQALEPINMLAACPDTNYGYQILKVLAVGGEYFVQHIKPINL